MGTIKVDFVAAEWNSNRIAITRTDRAEIIAADVFAVDPDAISLSDVMVGETPSLHQGQCIQKTIRRVPSPSVRLLLFATCFLAPLPGPMPDMHRVAKAQASVNPNKQEFPRIFHKGRKPWIRHLLAEHKPTLPDMANETGSQIARMLEQGHG